MPLSQRLALSIIAGLVCVVAIVALTKPPSNPYLALLELMLWFDVPAVLVGIALTEKFRERGEEDE